MRFLKRIILILFLLVFIAIGTVLITVTFYKKELASMLIDSLKQNYGLTLKTQAIHVSILSNWPNTSVQFQNISLVNDREPQEPLLKAKSLSLAFNIEKLLHKEFSVNSIALDNGEINLVKGMTGIKNYEFVKEDSASDNKNSNIHFEITRVAISNTKFKFNNKRYNKKIDFLLIDNVINLKNYADGLEAHLTGNVFVNGLLFRPEKGAFLSNTPADLDLVATICYPRKEIYIHQPSYAEIEGQRYSIAAFVELKNKKHLSLLIENSKADYQHVISLLNPGVKKGLSNLKVKQPLNAKALIMVDIGEQQDPIIIVHVNTKNNDVEVGNSGVPYSRIDFSASIISLDSSLSQGDADHAKVILKPLTGKVYDFDFKGELVIHGFTNPDIVVNANLFIDTKRIKLKPGQDFELKGKALAVINYKGPVSMLNHKSFLDPPMKLKALVKFDNVCFKERLKPYVYCFNGKAYVIDNYLKFDNLALKMDGGNFKLKGSVDNFVKYSIGYANGFKAKLIASTDYFDVTGYLKKTVSDSVSSSSKEKMEVKIENANESNFEFDVSLTAKKLIVRKVNADDASIKMHYKDKLLEINSLKVKTCEGTLFAKGSIYDLHKIDASFATENINVNHLFEQFENFGQKAIESKNLSGKVSLDAKIKMELDDKMEVNGNSMIGKISFKIKDGHLIGYEPLENISNFIFKNRDFKDIYFTEINETLFIDGFRIDIEEMEIASNVLNLYMSGIYHFKDNSNINILLPWSNLKKRGKNYIPQSSDKNAEDSKGLKLNYSGFPGKLKLKLGHKPSI
ncbi:MAG: AsmA-like C-terminal region-containing protein [Bacteroidota bacterium]